MKKRGLISFWLIAALAWFAPANVHATGENLLTNGEFAANFLVLVFGVVSHNLLSVTCKIQFLSR